MNFFKKYKCEKCNEKFKQQEEKMHHELIKHSKKMYDCKKCGVEFSGMEQMRTHIQRHHTFKARSL